jgi:hypothetical protein
MINRHLQFLNYSVDFLRIFFCVVHLFADRMHKLSNHLVLKLIEVAAGEISAQCIMIHANSEDSQSDEF